jgi:hypothetical protein
MPKAISKSCNNIFSIKSWWANESSTSLQSSNLFNKKASAIIDDKIRYGEDNSKEIIEITVIFIAKISWVFSCSAFEYFIARGGSQEGWRN